MCSHTRMENETAEKPYGLWYDLLRQEEPMLRASYTPMLSDQDHMIFDTLVPSDHYLRRVNAVVDFERYRATMAACYHTT